MTFNTIDGWHCLRICMLFILGFICLIVIGYQSLLPILIDNGVFNSYCNSGDDVCNTQLLILSFMFESSVSGLNISTLFWGSLCLKYNPKKIMTFGGIISIVSCILFAYGSDWIKFVSYILLGFGGVGLLFPTFVIPLQYSVKYQGFIFGILIGGQDSSAIIFYIFKLIYDNSNANVSLQMLFVFLAVVYFIALFLGPMFLFSDKLFSDECQTIDEDPSASSQETSPLKTNDHDDELNNDLEEAVDDDVAGIDGHEDVHVSQTSLFAMLHVIFQRLLGDILFWMIVIWSGLYVNTKYFYIATLNQQLKWITDNNTLLINRALSVFDILLPCACVFTPFSGVITNKLGFSFSVCMLGIISFITAITSVIQIYYLQYFTMVLIIFNRFLYFVIAPMIVGNVYGMKEQTTIYGIVLCLAAIYNYISYLWDYICIDILNYDFTVVNLSLGTSCFIASLCTAYLVNNRLTIKAS